MNELIPCPFCGDMPTVIDENNEGRFFQLRHPCMWFKESFIIDWCPMERIVRLWNRRAPAISTDYESVRSRDALYWAKNIFDTIPYGEWRIVAVVDGMWYFINGQCGGKVESGEWIHAPQPSSDPPCDQSEVNEPEDVDVTMRIEGNCPDCNAPLENGACPVQAGVRAVLGDDPDA